MQALDETGGLLTERDVLGRDNFLLVLVGEGPMDPRDLGHLAEIVASVGAVPRGTIAVLHRLDYTKEYECSTAERGTLLEWRASGYVRSFSLFGGREGILI